VSSRVRSKWTKERSIRNETLTIRKEIVILTLPFGQKRVLVLVRSLAGITDRHPEDVLELVLDLDGVAFGTARSSFQVDSWKAMRIKEERVILDQFLDE